MTRFIITLLISILLVITNVYSQHSKIRIGANGGFSILTSSQHQSDKGAFTGHLDGEYRYSDKLGLGLEIGINTFDNTLGLNGFIYTYELLVPILVKGRYYITTGNIQLYTSLALGAGIFFPDGPETSSNSLIQSNFIMKPEVGVNIHWFNIGLAYNLNGNYEVAYRNTAVSYNTIEVSIGVNLYLGKK